MLNMVKRSEKEVVKSNLCQARRDFGDNQGYWIPGSKNTSIEKTRKGKVSILLPQLRYSGSNAISLKELQRVLGSSIEDRVLICAHPRVGIHHRVLKRRCRVLINEMIWSIDYNMRNI